MDPAPEKPQDRPAAAAPCLEMRLVAWFAIYFAGHVQVFTHGYCQGDFLLLLIMFPMTLGALITPIALVLPEFMAPVVTMVFYIGGFVLYGWHLYATVKATTRRRFDILMVVLVLAVLANQWLFCAGAITN